MLPFQLRKFFAWFLLAENFQANALWQKYKDYFSEDFKTNKENNALNCINDILLKEDMSCKDFGLPEPDTNILEINSDIYKGRILISKKIFDSMYLQLNKDQIYIFEQLINGSKKIHFIDGPGGSRKLFLYKLYRTFLYRTLIYYFLSIEKKISHRDCLPYYSLTISLITVKLIKHIANKHNDRSMMLRAQDA